MSAAIAQCGNPRQPLHLHGLLAGEQSRKLLPAHCRCCSIDGDADRLMYFTPGQSGGAQLMDGDKIASLAALLVKDLISQLPANGSLPTVRHAAAPVRPEAFFWLAGCKCVAGRSWPGGADASGAPAGRRSALCRRRMPMAAPVHTCATSCSARWR